ncbi:hypothetical protein ACFVVA_28700 [Kitasatospora sp. NPDC058048]|uniref:hypothetical protein n=1 Tax=Kitasatospora sp. NPDC058048 TaxID=3346313 RepID=UPI0036DA1411
MTTTPGPIPVEPTHTWLITLQKPLSYGVSTLTLNGVLTPEPGETRQSAYRKIRNSIDRQEPDMVGANVLFFSLEPYRL